MKSNAMIRKMSKTHIIVYAGLLIAISAVLKILFEVYIPLGGFPSLRINLNSIPIIVSGILLGPIPGFCVGVISDLICFIIKPNGPWFFGFTLSSGLTGFLPAFLLQLIGKRNVSWVKWLNLVLAGATLGFLFFSGTLEISGATVYFMQEPINLYIFGLFLLLLILFALYPFLALKFLKKTEAVDSENLLLVITIEQIINSVFLNTLWLTILYGQAWMVLLPGRVITNIFLIPIYTLLVAVLLKFMPKS